MTEKRDKPKVRFLFYGEKGDEKTARALLCILADASHSLMESIFREYAAREDGVSIEESEES